MQGKCTVERLASVVALECCIAVEITLESEFADHALNVCIDGFYFESAPLYPERCGNHSEIALIVKGTEVKSDGFEVAGIQVFSGFGVFAQGNVAAHIPDGGAESAVGDEVIDKSGKVAREGHGAQAAEIFRTLQRAGRQGVKGRYGNAVDLVLVAGEFLHVQFNKGLPYVRQPFHIDVTPETALFVPTQFKFPALDIGYTAADFSAE